MEKEGWLTAGCLCAEPADSVSRGARRVSAFYFNFDLQECHEAGLSIRIYLNRVCVCVRYPCRVPTNAVRIDALHRCESGWHPLMKLVVSSSDNDLFSTNWLIIFRVGSVMKLSNFWNVGVLVNFGVWAYFPISSVCSLCSLSHVTQSTEGIPSFLMGFSPVGLWSVDTSQPVC